MKKIIIITLVLISSLLILVSCNDEVKHKDLFNNVPLTIEFPDDGRELTDAKIIFGNADFVTIYYTKNGDTNLKLVKNSEITDINAGDTISLYADRANVLNHDYLKIDCTEYCYVYGNVMSLIKKTGFEDVTAVFEDAFRELFKDNKHIKSHFSNPIVLGGTDLGARCYQKMFSGCSGLTDMSNMVIAADVMSTEACLGMFEECTSLTKAPELPATVMAESCYKEMFFNCSRLVDGPSKLPADKMKESSCRSMFRNCSSLVSAPVLKAKEVAESCYAYMFENCENLTTAMDVLPATTLYKECYYGMFLNCKELGNAPHILATTLAPRCCKNMFAGCISLTTVQDELYAEKLTVDCYNAMFKDCKSLTTAPYLPAETTANDCYGLMFSGCSSLTTFQDCLPALKMEDYCYSHMFEDCSSLTKAPDIPATEVGYSSCNAMFMGCTKITESPVLYSEQLQTLCYNDMFKGCSSLTDITCLAKEFSPQNNDTSDMAIGAVETGVLYVADGMVDNWSQRVSSITILPAGWTIQVYQPEQPEE